MSAKTGRRTVRWRARVRGIYRTAVFPTKREALDWEARARAGALSERGPEILIRDFYRVHEEDILGGIAPNTKRVYQSIYKVHFLPTMGHRTLESVTALDIERLQRSWVARGLAPSTIQRHRNAVARLFNVAEKARLLDGNPVRGADKPPRPLLTKASIPSEVELAEVIQLLRQRKDLYADFVTVCAYCGLRVAEAEALQVADVDMARGVLNIRRASDGAGGFKNPKDNQARVAPMPGPAREALQRLVAGKEPAAAVFLGERGGRWNRANFLARSGWREATAAVGHPSLTLRDLRAVAITSWGELGLSLNAVKELAGHSDPRTTDRYLRPLLATDELSRRVNAAYATRTQADPLEGGERHVGGGENDA